MCIVKRKKEKKLTKKRKVKQLFKRDKETKKRCGKESEE